MATQDFGSVLIQHPSYDVAAKVRANYDGNPKKHSGAFVSTATLVLDTGACAVQVYATEQALRELADMLTRAADAVAAGVLAAEQLEAA